AWSPDLQGHWAAGTRRATVGPLPGQLDVRSMMELEIETGMAGATAVPRTTKRETFGSSERGPQKCRQNRYGDKVPAGSLLDWQTNYLRRALRCENNRIATRESHSNLSGSQSASGPQLRGRRPPCKWMFAAWIPACRRLKQYCVWCQGPYSWGK